MVMLVLCVCLVIFTLLASLSLQLRVALKLLFFAATSKLLLEVLLGLLLVLLD